MQRLTHIEEIELCKSVQSGDQKAVEKIVSGNVGLVRKIANKMYFKNPQYSFDDLYQEGVFGLIRAAEKFDPKEGCRFSTYSYQWIRSFIGRYIENNLGKIRTPSHLTQKMNKLDKDSEEYRKLKETIPNVISINKLVGESSTLEDLVCDNGTCEENLEFAIIMEQLKDVLNEREMFVIEHRFGINNETPKSHRECAKLCDVTYGTIFNIEKKAIKKLQEHFN